MKNSIRFVQIIAFTILSLFLFVSCEKDPITGQGLEIVGTWQMTHRIGSVTPLAAGGQIDEYDEDYTNFKIQYKKNGTYTEWENVNGTWEQTKTGTWKYEDGSIYSDGLIYPEKILTLDSTTLVTECYISLGSFLTYRKISYKKL